MNTSKADWRNDPGLQHTTEYKQKFAIFPVTCCDGTKVWMNHYYVKYLHWGHTRSRVYNDDSMCLHTDRIENVSEEEYVIRKLAETL